ncbi:MAG: hypothetical protein JXR13_10415 [Thalassovita sp.]
MTVRTFALIAALATLAACGGRSEQLEVRNGPQTQHYLDGSVINTQQDCSGVNRYLCGYGAVQNNVYGTSS